MAFKVSARLFLMSGYFLNLDDQTNRESNYFSEL